MFYPRAQHVWVTDVKVFGNEGSPGLLLGWMHTKRGWEGWVISAQDGIGAHGGGPYLRQGWVLAQSIRPAKTR